LRTDRSVFSKEKKLSIVALEDLRFHCPQLWLQMDNLGMQVLSARAGEWRERFRRRPSSQP